MKEAAAYRWIILVMAYIGMFAFAMVFQSIPPLLTFITQDFGISNAQAGLLMSLFALPGIVIGLPSGIISDRFSTKSTGIASLLVMIGGTIIVGASSTLLHAYTGRVLSGVGGLTLAIILPQLVSKWFLSNELSIGMGIFNTAMPFGTILSLNLFSRIGEPLGWKPPIFLTTAISILALLVFLWLFKPPIERGERPTGNLLKALAKLGPSIWLVGFSWMWFNAAFISFITFSSKFFVENGYFEIASAGSWSSLVMMGSLCLSPLVGYFVHRIGREEVFVGGSGVALAALIFFIPTSAYVIPLLVLIGVFAALVPAPIFSLPSKIVKPKNFGLAFGIITACLNIGVLIGPFVAGLARDHTGNYILSFYLLALFAVLQTATIGLYRLSRP